MEPRAGRDSSSCRFNSIQINTLQECGGVLKGATATCLRFPAECLCLFLPLVNLPAWNVLALSHSYRYEWKGINKSKLLAGLSSAGSVHFTLLLPGKSPHLTVVPTPSPVGVGAATRSAQTRWSHDTRPVQSRRDL